MQVWANTNRGWLLAQGIDYPDRVQALSVPKHQFLVPMLWENRLDDYHKVMRGARAETVFLSTEGLSNHFHDYSAGVLAAFRAANAGIRVSAVFVQRDPLDWLRALYKQSLLNPTNPKLHYGTALQFSEFIALRRIARMVEFDRLSRDVADGFGAQELIRIDLAGGWLTPLGAHLGVDPAGSVPVAGAQNVSVPDALAELVRQVNGMGLEAPLRQAFLALVQTSERSQHAMLLESVTGLHQSPVRAAQLAACLARLQETLATLGPRW